MREREGLPVLEPTGRGGGGERERERDRISGTLRELGAFLEKLYLVGVLSSYL